jgi:glutathione S-transferase
VVRVPEHTTTTRVRCEPADKEGLAAATSSAAKDKYEEWQKTSSLSSLTPEAFKIQEGYTWKLVGASIATLTTALAGAFSPGYKGQLKKKEDQADEKYILPVSVGGYQWEEQQSFQGKVPAQPVTIYEFQGCPFCRKVRVAVSALGLDVLFKPCPSGGKHWRPEAIEKGGKSQFPYMVDPNTGTEMYESGDIINYLFQEYGPGEVPSSLSLRNSAIANSLGMLGRMGAGSRAKESDIPTKPLDLWGYEASPFVGLVKEVLCELEIPYVQHSAPRGSAKRQEIFEKKGRFQVPYLEDANTGAELFESSAIIDYLQFVYAK